jgi:hypothetical protein
MHSSTHSLTLALDGVVLSDSCPTHFTPMKRAPSTQWIGGWVDPRVSQDRPISKVTDYDLDDWGSTSGRGWDFSLGWSVRLIIGLHVVSTLECMQFYFHSPILLHGMMLS